MLIISSLTNTLCIQWAIGFMKGFRRDQIKLEGDFSCEGVGNKKNYLMIKLAGGASKEFIGLGFVDTRSLCTYLQHQAMDLELMLILVLVQNNQG